MTDHHIVSGLPPLTRFALAYAPSRVRKYLLAVFGLDQRLADIVRNSREPMLAQLRLAWWREALTSPAAAAPPGEPLLALFGDWPEQRAAAAGLVDGWEAVTGQPPLPATAFAALAEARAGALAAIAKAPAHRVAALTMGRAWALADLASHLSHPVEAQTALDLARATDWRRSSLPRDLRPLAILHGVAARTLRGLVEGEGAPHPRSPGALLAAIRIGIVGR